MTGDDFRETRESLGLSQQQLADVLNVSKRTLARWEKDTPPPHPTAVRVLEWICDDLFWPPEAP